MNPLNERATSISPTIVQQAFDNMTDEKLGMASESFDNFLGFGKNAKVKRGLRSEKKIANTEIKKAKAYSMRTLADKGIQFKSGASSIADGLGSLVGKLTGSGGNADAGSAAQDTGTTGEGTTEGTTGTPEKKGNVIFYIVGGLAVLVVMYLLLRKSKK